MDLQPPAKEHSEAPSFGKDLWDCVSTLEQSTS